MNDNKTQIKPPFICTSIRRSTTSSCSCSRNNNNNKTSDKTCLISKREYKINVLSIKLYNYSKRTNNTPALKMYIYSTVANTHFY